MPIKAILYDMDGVLIDARDWHYEALNDALGLFGYTISRESHLTTFDGLPTRKKLEILTHAQGLPEGLHEFLNSLKQSFTMRRVHLCCRPTYIHQRALSAFHQAGYKQAVCSNSVRGSVTSMMELSGLDTYLDTIVSNEDVANAKPHPEMYQKAMEVLGVHPHESLILEDNEHGIQAAIASGGHLLKIGSPNDVSYGNIKQRIAEIDQS
ncbi:MAG: HAD family phosphatase [Alphaproteobacteria bacterium]